MPVNYTNTCCESREFHLLCQSNEIHPESQDWNKFRKVQNCYKSWNRTEVVCNNKPMWLKAFEHILPIFPYSRISLHMCIQSSFLFYVPNKYHYLLKTKVHRPMRNKRCIWCIPSPSLCERLFIWERFTHRLFVTVCYVFVVRCFLIIPVSVLSSCTTIVT